jgi:serine/threonine-protein kinase
MDPDAISLFREVADRPPSEREEYYTRHNVPAALRGEVESLLRFDGETHDAIHRRVASAAVRAILGNLEALRAGPSAITETTADPRNAGLSSEIGEGRFPAGTLLGKRYRIVSLLGRGGMGEVYRAIDLKLRQPVALKFLPEATAHDAGWLARFHGEVRLARQISHPNVCRVYDIGEFDGAAYISMEYIDGEDLASLLRRIGRLPHDKALEIARRLCAGLAAAHDKGVVHRDLKPANIMIDSRGHVFITDFGLASTAGRLEDAHVRSGTPAYMAPEQLQGRAVSTRSDLYALGLVLYEMFTGTRPFNQTRKSTDRPQSLSSVAKDLDRAVARTIEHCLEADPRDRPNSALAVAALLPGGNPLAEALALGQTPSPQMVAAAQNSDAISVRSAFVGLVFVIAGLAAALSLGSRVSFLRTTPFENPPEALLLKVREMIAAFGYATTPRDRDWSYFWNGNFQRLMELNVPRAEYRAQLALGRPPLISFRYRQSEQYLLFFRYGSLDASDPPLRGPGDVYLSLDQLGRLQSLEAVPLEEDYPSRSDRVFDWDLLFTAADIDRSRYTSDEPKWIPPVTFDRRAAWSGTFAHAPSVPMRIEAASWKGRPVYFRIFNPASISFQGRRIFSTRGYDAGLLLYFVVPWLVVAGAMFVAWRNHNFGRSDLRGAARLATGVFGCSLVAWAVTAHHVPTYEYLPATFRSLSAALSEGAIGGLLYMAVEPFVRRRWPQSLITWTRVLSGRVRDPLVGTHVLVGTACGTSIAIWVTVKMWLLVGEGYITPQDWNVLQGPGWVLNSWLWILIWSVTLALGMLVLFLLARVILRRDWIASICVVLMVSAQPILLGPRPLMEAAFEIPAAGLFLWILIRLGVLPMIVAQFVVALLTSFPLASDFTAWYSGPTLFALATVLGLAIWSFRVALAGRRVLQDEFLEASG